MMRVSVAACALAAAIATTVALNGAAAQQDSKPAAKPASPSGWILPPDAEETKNPYPVDEQLLASGKAIFKDKCQRCHGPGGLGDGPDADPDHQEDMDLTNPKRAARNSDGVVFHKVSNGRRRPKMPPFKEELTTEQLWAVVAYTQSLRKKS
jgi:mono/diheme cytochrome c family protein